MTTAKEAVRTGGMTNSEIAAARKDALGAIQRQVRFLIEKGSARKPCPNCGEPHNLPQAAGVGFDAYDFGRARDDPDFRCRGCGRRLVYVLPWPTGDWHWWLDPAEAAARG